MSDPVLLERGLLSQAWLWKRTLELARRNVASPASLRQRNHVRLQSLAPTKQPVFILGCPRSGTTYLGSLLEALPEATYFFEPPLLKYSVRPIKKNKLPSWAGALTYRAALHALMLAAPGSGHRVIEKNPNHVFLARELLDYFPSARLVVITRDGRDVAVSLSEKPWHREDSRGSGLREPGGYLYGPHPHFYIEEDRRAEFESTTDLHRCIWIWRQHQEEVERFRSALPQQAQHHLTYESLVQSPNQVLPGLLDFLDIGESDREPVYEMAQGGRVDSVGRWRRTLSEAEINEVNTEAGPLLQQLGYV